jgi:hypothetical protein
LLSEEKLLPLSDELREEFVKNLNPQMFSRILNKSDIDKNNSSVYLRDYTVDVINEKILPPDYSYIRKALQLKYPNHDVELRIIHSSNLVRLQGTTILYYMTLLLFYGIHV